MDYYIGIDGGGTKTAFMLADETGRIQNSIVKSGISYRQIGMQGVLDSCRSGVEELCQNTALSKANVSLCIGVPNFGESKVMDQEIQKELKNLWSTYKVKVVNDGEVGMAAALGSHAGIHIVAGTGSIAFARNEQGQVERCGGWSEHFGDEGSCRWLGMKTMEYFSKEADGRLPKGPLYEEIMRQFALEDPYDVIDRFEQEYLPYRDKIASLQMVLLKAAKKGDLSAKKLYQMAAEELAEIIFPLYKKLWKKDQICKVTYTGGLFKTGEMMKEPLADCLKKYPGLDLVEPAYEEPVYGAVLLAAEQMGKQIEIKL